MSNISSNSFDITNDIISLKNNFRLETQGSEAKVYKGTFLGRKAVLKERFVKHYRHPDLDKNLSIERIKAEVRALCKCQELGVKCPAIYFADSSSRVIVMEEISDSLTVKEYLKIIFAECGDTAIEKACPLAEKIGSAIGKMHKNDLMHGDLTTSNMLVIKEQLECIASKNEFDLYFIDFGLSRRDVSIEDKAVDLYVLERALSSSHPKSQPLYETIVKSYLKNVGKNATVISEKLEEVRQRGRKRTMVG